MATQLIYGRNISAGTVDSTDLADGAVTTAKIAAGAVGSTELAAGSVTATKLASGIISSSALQANSILTAAIADSQVTAAKLADGAVTSTKLAGNAVTSAAITDGAVTAGKIGPSAVDTTELASNAVTTAKILDANVTTAKLNASSVTSAKIAAGAVQTSHLATGELHFAADTTSLANKKIIFNFQLDGVTLASGPSADISSALTSETAVTSAGSSEGVITDSPKNRCTIRDVDFAALLDGGGNEVYGLLTQASGVWTLTYRSDISGTPTAYSLPAPESNCHIMVPKRYNLNVAPEDAFRNAAQFTNNTSALASHTAQSTGAHLASAIAVTDAANHFTTKNVEAALNAIVGPSWVQGTHDSLNAHLTKATGAHAATAVSFVPDTSRTTDLTSAQVNAAIEELHAEVEALQASPASASFGFKYFLATNGQTVFSVVGAPNAPFAPGNNSLEVFVDGILNSFAAGHYTEDPTGNFFTLTDPAALNANVIARWYK